MVTTKYLRLTGRSEKGWIEVDSNDDGWWIGIDVGGTFTDLVAVQRSTGTVLDTKVLTSKPYQEDGVLAGLAKIGIPIEQVDEIVHGHTSGINAVLSRDGAKTALLATAGHKDLLDIGRMDRPFGVDLYDPTWLRPHQARPVVRRRDRHGIPERISENGTVLLELDEDHVRQIAHDLREAEIESVAICFMNSYLTRVHEERAAEIIREEIPDAYVQTSELYPVTKEHERTTTVVFDAYVGPIVTNYLRRLERSLGEIGFRGTLWIMTMNGGVGSVAETSKAPVFQLVSGPVGGVSGIVQLVRSRGGHENFVSMDVGGTSTDVAAVQDGETPMTDLWEIEHGLVMTMPAVDVQSVGSGAGSIIMIDDLGSIRVGPESAGSNPGPAAYGRGGTEPTLTDACVHLGILQPELFAGGDITLEPTLAVQALTAVADRIGMNATELADGAYRLASTDMASALRAISTHRGVDLRGFSLLAFGAAGPMMAVAVARDLGMKSVVIPPHPGEFSAYGLVSSDLRVTRAQSPFIQLNSIKSDFLEELFASLEKETVGDLLRQGVDESDITLERSIFAMYAGQTWDNRVPIASEPIDDDAVARIISDVHAFYNSRYGYSADELPIIVTSIEVTAAAERFGGTPNYPTDQEGDSLLKTASLRLAGIDHPDAPVHGRARMRIGVPIPGPAVIVEQYATTVLDAGSSASLDSGGNLNIILKDLEEKS
ncbi:hydantoinase/oxoprolinase family protein [Citricoccus parietis]|uniref:Hydantoinase/oxoprolinase family protein n=1 Tax=Citricoccus parietis TaxID=592307 RepID=A0ABV6F3L9_9MICC